MTYTPRMKGLTLLPLLLVAVCANAERYPEGYADDRAAIVDLQARYVMAMDYFDADGYAAVFAEDGSGCDLALHGHAHHGSERGITPGGVPVRNVAKPLIRSAYQLYALHAHGDRGAASARASVSQDELHALPAQNRSTFA